MSTRRRHNPRFIKTAVAARSRDLCRSGRDCPAPIKRDPRSVGWTCARCAAVVQSLEAAAQHIATVHAGDPLRATRARLDALE
jgi:hypothetical protein